MQPTLLRFRAVLRLLLLLQIAHIFVPVLSVPFPVPMSRTTTILDIWHTPGLYPPPPLPLVAELVIAGMVFPALASHKSGYSFGNWDCSEHFEDSVVCLSMLRTPGLLHQN